MTAEADAHSTAADALLRSFGAEVTGGTIELYRPGLPDNEGLCVRGVPVIVRPASEEDTPGFVELARQVEQWFGPMVGEPGFLAVLARHIRRGTALVATTAGETDVLGGMLFSAKPPVYHVRWLVVSEHARGKGIGRALMSDAIHRFVTDSGVVEVVTFGADHPGASASGARAFYERLGFTPAESAAPGPDGGSRQLYRKAISHGSRRS